jgi:hypothetical protein
VHESVGIICIFFSKLYIILVYFMPYWLYIITLVAIGLMIPNVTIQTYAVDCFRSYSASITGKAWYNWYH